MAEFNHLKGYLLRNAAAPAAPGTGAAIKYFVLGPQRKLYTTSNLALLQLLMRSSETLRDLLARCEESLKALHFDEIAEVSPARPFDAPETLHFYSTKHFQATFKCNDPAAGAEGGEPNGSFVASSEAREPRTFSVFAFDDEFTEEMSRFFARYNALAADREAVERLLALKVPVYRAEESGLLQEPVVTQSYIDGFTRKMKLMTRKIELDRREAAAGARPARREVVEEGESADQKVSQRIVTLSNGSKYVGGIANRRPHGNGKEFLADGTSYVGEFRNGLWHGSGYLIDSENSLCYGEFIDDRVVGI